MMMRGDAGGGSLAVSELSRKVRKLRRRVYRDLPVATWNRVAEFDYRRPYAELARLFARGDRGVLSGGAALALWRAATERGLRAWCYDCGFPESLTHMVTVVEVDGALEVHDAFFNLRYPVAFHTLLDCLRAGVAVAAEAQRRDRKLYLADPAFEPEAAMRWLEAHAERELAPKTGLRRFELLWDQAAFAATSAEIEAAWRDLEAHGHPRDLSYLMLHPLAVFDGEQHHRDRALMPLVGGRDLGSPVARLRLAAAQRAEETAAARAAAAERAAELSQANARLSAALEEAERLRSAGDDASRRFEAERAAFARERDQLGAKLHDAIALRAKLQAELQVLRAEASSLTAERDASSRNEARLQADQARLAAELEGANDQLAAAVAEADQLRSHVGQLRAALDDAERQSERERRALLRERDELDVRLGEALAGTDAVRAEKQQAEDRAAALQSRVEAVEQYATDLARHLADLVEQEAAANAALAKKDAAIGMRDESLDRVVAKARRFLGGDALTESDAVCVVDEIGRRLRQIECELDRAICERDRHTACVKPPPARSRDAGLAGLLRRLRRLPSLRHAGLSLSPR
jgi:hypothetical protein